MKKLDTTCASSAIPVQVTCILDVSLESLRVDHHSHKKEMICLLVRWSVVIFLYVDL